MAEDSLRRATEAVARIQHLLSQHEAWRSSCLNLTASENVTSPLVRRLLGSDLVHRYADYDTDPEVRKYRGTRYIRDIERETASLARELFGARFAELRPIGGHVAGLAALAAAVRPGDTVMETSSEIGGHRTATKLGLAPMFSHRTVFLPSNVQAYNVDVERSMELIRKVKPRALILGSSFFLFPHPVRELSAAAHELGALVVYDASHVFGLIAGGLFQDPLAEGADLLVGSTHKTLPGPQGGIILTNSEELAGRVARLIYPSLVDNHHPFRMPALAACLAEAMAFGKAYARQIVSNARSLGAELVRRGIPLVGEDSGFTCSHTLLLRVERFGTAAEVALKLEEKNVILNAVTLPEALGIHGLRAGVQEMTRLGARESDMAEVGEILVAALGTAEPEAVRARIKALRARLSGIGYCFDL